MDIDVSLIPTEIIKGDTLKEKLSTSLNDGDNVTVEMKSSIANIGRKSFVVQGGNVTIFYSHDETERFLPGDFILTLKAHAGDMVKTLYSAPVEVVEHGNGAKLQELTEWKNNVKAINAVLGNAAKSEHQSYTIAGRQINRMPPSELIQLREYFMRRIRDVDNSIHKRRSRSNVIVHRFRRTY